MTELLTGLLLDLPIILVAMLIGFAGLLIIDAEKRQSKNLAQAHSDSEK